MGRKTIYFNGIVVNTQLMCALQNLSRHDTKLICTHFLAILQIAEFVPGKMLNEYTAANKVPLPLF